jgi:hypothetical protein
VIAPPTVHLTTFQSKLRKDINVASQDAFPSSGAHTGETPVAMLKDLNVGYAIIGHSERRQKGESDEVVANKVKAAIDSGITAIACIGETLAERDAGKTIEVVERQLKVRCGRCRWRGPMLVRAHASRPCREAHPPPPLPSPPHPLLRAPGHCQGRARLCLGQDCGGV